MGGGAVKFDIFEIFNYGSAVFDVWKEFSKYLPMRYLKKKRKRKKEKRHAEKRRLQALDSPYIKEKSHRRFKKNVRSAFERGNWFLYKAESFWYFIQHIEKKF